MRYIIYGILCNITDEIYVGSSSKPLDIRMKWHINKSNGCISRQIINRGDYDASIIEDLGECELHFALQKEKYWIDELQSINIKYPILSPEELKQRQHNYNITVKRQNYKSGDYSKYYQENKEQIKQNVKLYRIENCENIKQKRGEVIQCDCGKSYTFGNRLRHLKSKYHLKCIDERIK